MAKDRVKERPSPALLEDDFGITFEPPASAGDAVPETVRPASRGQVETWTRAYFENVETFRRVKSAAESTAGELLHTIGTYLRELRGRAAWVPLGLADWEAFCRERLLVSERHARRLMFFADAVTREQAAFGVRKCLAGLALVQKLKLDGLGDLVLDEETAEPPEWEALLGEKVLFRESSASRLERLAAGPRKPALPPPSPSRRVIGVVAARREIVARVAKRHPALEALGARSYAKDGEARVSHRPATTDEEFAALAALYAALAKG